MRFKRTTIKRILSRIYAALAFISFIFMFGAIGGVERDIIGFVPGTLQTVYFMCLLVLFTYLAVKVSDGK